ncbi:cytochrome P450 4d2-like [Thrips palmi]|uniref:Cytochrome P450 4d2-like n=1 Tax=Thrips palmi TaxID=161013 RepID=A0A6P8YCH2_THRPL|nr:cytochrome P450 4d2-like [Thrips palmi]
MIAKYGYLLRFWFGPKLVVCVIDPKDVEAVISSPSCAAKPDSAYRLLETVLGKGMASLNGPEHRRHRKMILPLLHRDMLAQFQPLMHLSALELADSLADKAASGEVFDVSMLCGLAALNVTYRTILDVDQGLYEATREQRRLVVESTTRVSELLWYRVVRPWRHPDWLFRLDPNHAELEQVIGLYDRLITDVLDDKLDKMSEPRQQQSRRSLLDILLDSEGGRTLSRAEVFAELKTMVAGTFATSMDVMSMVLLVLSLLPDELARIHRELDDVLGDRPLETADLDHLCALERLIREALRYYPPFPVLGRTCEKDLRLPSGHTLPAGCYIALCPLATQWHPEYYPRPEKFDPDRFLAEAAAARPACSFLPFSAGIRGCIGERYTFMLLKTCLATVLRRYDVLPDPDGPKEVQRIKMTVSITFHPKNGCKLRLRQRQRPPAGG